MNLLDRAIAWASPERGLARARARLATRAYEGAKAGRRTERWLTPATSANTEIARDGAALRNRARDLVRNNPYATRVVDVMAANVVGAGIMPVVRTRRARLDRQVEDLWLRFVEQCDAEGQLDFYGLQQLAVRCIVESGEVLTRFRPRFASDGLPVPLQLQLLEPDYLDTSRDTVQPGQSGETLVYQGIEFDALGRRSGYYLYGQHPGESRPSLKGLVSSRVPAPEVLHVYRKQRPGQIRGVSWLAPIVLKARDLDDYHDAALVKAKTEACFSGFVTQPDGEMGPGVAPQGTDADGDRVEFLQPGMLSYLRPGEDVTFAAPTSSGAFEPYTLQTLMAMAVGAGITYDQLTGDLRQANYSSLRAGKIEFRRLVEQIQYQALVPMLCRPVWDRFVNAAILAGKLPPGEYRAEWIAPRHEPIDPLKDMRADVEAVRAGAMTWRQFVASWGCDARRQLAEIAEINAEMDAAGVTLDTDPRRRTQSGIATTDEANA